MTAETGLAGPGFLLLITTFFAKANLKWPDMVHMKSTPIKALCRYMESVNQVRTGSGNDLSPVWQQAITWSNAHLLLIRSLMINFTDIWINIWNFFFESFRKLKENINHHVSTSNNVITHWGRVTHIYVSKLTIFGSYNGLAPGRRQSVIWTNAGILLIWPLPTNFSEILIQIHIFSFQKTNLKMSSGKWRPFCLVNPQTNWKAWVHVYSVLLLLNG